MSNSEVDNVLSIVDGKTMRVSKMPKTKGDEISSVVKAIGGRLRPTFADRTRIRDISNGSAALPFRKLFRTAIHSLANSTAPVAMPRSHRHTNTVSHWTGDDVEAGEFRAPEEALAVTRAAENECGITTGPCTGRFAPDVGTNGMSNLTAASHHNQYR